VFHVTRVLTRSRAQMEDVVKHAAESAQGYYANHFGVASAYRYVVCAISVLVVWVCSHARAITRSAIGASASATPGGPVGSSSSGAGGSGIAMSTALLVCVVASVCS
jgi:hypothetical protein